MKKRRKCYLTLSNQEVIRREAKRDRRNKRRPLKRNKTEAHNPKVLLDINAPESDTANLLLMAKNWSYQLQLNYNKIYEEMMGCDNREELLEVFKSYFEEFVTFYE